MKYGRTRLTLALVISVPLAIILSTGCATARGVKDYDGALDIPDSPADSSLLVPIHIENHRTIDPIDPTFYLTGSGRHSLGVVQGFGGRLDRMVDTAWFGSDGCLTITAHYAGAGDFIFDKLCWKRGERIEAALDNIFNPISAWSHR